MHERCDRFVPVTEYKGLSAADLYMWHVTNDLRCFVLLLPNPKSHRDSFMIELAWSSSGFPENAPLQRSQRLDTVGDGRLRLPQLWREKWSSALEAWWEFGDSLTLNNSEQFYSDEETQRRVKAIPALAEDAVTKITEYALPLFQRISAARARKTMTPIVRAIK